jgi:hypothetical protein
MKYAWPIRMAWRGSIMLMADKESHWTIADTRLRDCHARRRRGNRPAAESLFTSNDAIRNVVVTGHSVRYCHAFIA